MTPSILGTGWVTSSGRDVSEVVAAIQAEKTPARVEEKGPSGITIPTYRVDMDQVRDAAAFPRLRRSSKISLFAVSAAIDAVKAAGLTDEEAAAMGIIFAASNGGVIYTRRFFENIIRDGAGAGSPLLFPETVYNAPASHIAAYFRSDAPSLTLVGDAGTGVDALSAGLEMLANGEVNHCLVLGAEEIDGISVDAYARTGLLSGFAGKSGSSAVASEGAAAVVLGCEQEDRSHWKIAAGPVLGVYELRQEIPGVLGDVLARLGAGKPDRIVASGSGSPLEHYEHAAIQKTFPGVSVTYPSKVLGEAMVATSLQLLVATCNWLPLGGDSEVIVTTVGFGGQVAALRLTRRCPGD